jgi:parallel beta-helix repeat protein
MQLPIDPSWPAIRIGAGGRSLAAASSLFLLTQSALADPVEVTECGQVVTADAVLVDDLVCDTGAFEEVAIDIAASDITLDLGGHVVSGHPLGIGISAAEVEGITIQNGSVADFLVDIDLFEASDVTLQNLIISNLEIDDPDIFVPGLRITRSEGVTVRDCSFAFLPVAHKEAIVSASSEVLVDSIEMTGGSVGVNISGASDTGHAGSTISVVNSRFTGVTIAGVLVQVTQDSRIADNEFINNEMGVMADSQVEGRVTGLTVENNRFIDGYLGIQFLGTADSVVSRNRFHGNWRGISLQSNMECLDILTGPACFYATGNVISHNLAVGNFLDLHHRDLAVGNAWIGNKCQTREGAEIPECQIIFLDDFEKY